MHYPHNVLRYTFPEITCRSSDVTHRCKRSTLSSSVCLFSHSTLLNSPVSLMSCCVLESFNLGQEVTVE